LTSKGWSVQTNAQKMGRGSIALVVWCRSAHLDPSRLLPVKTICARKWAAFTISIEFDGIFTKLNIHECSRQLQLLCIFFAIELRSLTSKSFAICYLAQESEFSQAFHDIAATI
jgi:uncharacterized membrane protein YwzB